MAAISCYVADFNLVPTLPVINDLRVQGQTLSSYFMQASGTAQLAVTVDWSRRGRFPNLITSGGVGDAELYDGLGKLLGANGTAQNPCVGLLLADLYTPAPDQYGMMFDTDEGVTGVFGPRQGCAIFLRAIMGALDSAGLDTTALNEFISYTAIHELGHAFNLWHAKDSFMQPHPDPAHLAPFSFAPNQANYLGLVADNAKADYVLPGPGRKRFGNRPDGWPADDGDSFAGPSSKKSELRLRIALSHTSFWSFEPVELDVELSLSSEPPKSISVPNEIDPGYPSFQIWITRPNGERSLFRPQSRFCQSNGQRTITRKNPFRRDIAIFRQSGGYTFSAPGRHQVQAAFRVKPNLLLLSNVVECEVRPAEPTSKAWTRARTLLETRECKSVLRHKHRAPSHHTYAQLARFAEKSASAETSSAIHYALGKGLIRAAERMPRQQRAHDLRARAETHLRKTLHTKKLSLHRTDAVMTLLRPIS